MNELTTITVDTLNFVDALDIQQNRFIKQEIEFRKLATKMKREIALANRIRRFQKLATETRVRRTNAERELESILFNELIGNQRVIRLPSFNNIGLPIPEIGVRLNGEFTILNKTISGNVGFNLLSANQQNFLLQQASNIPKADVLIKIIGKKSSRPSIREGFLSTSTGFIRDIEEIGQGIIQTIQHPEVIEEKDLFRYLPSDFKKLTQPKDILQIQNEIDGEINSILLRLDSETKEIYFTTLEEEAKALQRLIEDAIFDKLGV